MFNAILLISGVQALVHGTNCYTSDLAGIIYSVIGGAALGWYNMRVNDEHRN